MHHFFIGRSFMWPRRHRLHRSPKESHRKTEGNFLHWLQGCFKQASTSAACFWSSAIFCSAYWRSWSCCCWSIVGGHLGSSVETPPVNLEPIQLRSSYKVLCVLSKCPLTGALLWNGSCDPVQKVRNRRDVGGEAGGAAEERAEDDADERRKRSWVEGEKGKRRGGGGEGKGGVGRGGCGDTGKKMKRCCGSAGEKQKRS